MGVVDDERKDGTRSCRLANLRARITATQARFGALGPTVALNFWQHIIMIFLSPP
jgi:hypothetical protein